jgi:hypothetical protein
MDALEYLIAKLKPIVVRVADILLRIIGIAIVGLVACYVGGELLVEAVHTIAGLDSWIVFRSVMAALMITTVATIVFSACGAKNVGSAFIILLVIFSFTMYGFAMSLP